MLALSFAGVSSGRASVVKEIDHLVSSRIFLSMPPTKARLVLSIHYVGIDQGDIKPKNCCRLFDSANFVIAQLKPVVDFMRIFPLAPSTCQERIGGRAHAEHVAFSGYMFQGDICAHIPKRTYCELRTNSVHCFDRQPIRAQWSKLGVCPASVVSLSNPGHKEHGT